MTRATVITDASWCPKSRVAGWAAWVAGDLWQSQGFSGPVAQKCSSSNEAEVIASAIGIGIAVRHFGASHVLIQSDSTYVQRHFWEHLPPDVRDRLIRVQYRHVKGHTNVKDSRSWVNRWCDKHAKDHMRSLRP